MATWKHLTDEEFLRDMERKIDMSPVLEEFARRLQTKIDKAPNDATNCRVTCPACDAPLEVDFEVGNNLFEIRYDKDSRT
jgi:hypothetical protein